MLMNFIQMIENDHLMKLWRVVLHLLFSCSGGIGLFDYRLFLEFVKILPILKVAE